MKKTKKRTIPESMRCSVCNEYAVKMCAGIRPRTCVECVIWPPDPKDLAAKAAREKLKSKGKRKPRE